MKFIIPLLFLVAVSNAAPQQSQSQAQFNYQNYLNSQTTTPAPIQHPPASIHYVNIGQELNGDYKFGYDTGKGPSGQSFREETRLPDGSVKGQYGYLDAQNKMRIVKYTAGLNGFSIDSDTALNEQQIAASRPTAPNPQYNPPAQEQPRYQQPSASSARQSFQGLAQAAQSSQPAYLPAPTALAQQQQQQQQQPYTGYQQQQDQQAALPQYNANAYLGSQQQLTPAQLQQQAQAAARARQAALARQQQQEAIIRQQQQAATEQILAQQRAALEAQQAEQAASKQNSYQPQYQNLASQYAAAQPQYQQQAPQPQPQPQPQQPAPQYQQPAPAQPPTYQSPQYQPASQPSYSSGSRTTELKPDVLSQFIQLPGTRLIQIDRPRPARAQSSLSSGLLSSNSAKPEEEETYGPVVINAALLNYDIGSSKLPNQQSSNKKA